MSKQPLLLTGTAVVLAVTAGVAIAIMSGPRTVSAAAPQESFSEDVFPIFKGRCVDCHRPGGEGFEKSGVDLSTYQGLMKGTKYGPMVIPGRPESSNLMRLLDWKVSPEIRMPHGKKKLSTCDRDAIRTWIRQGAKDN